jgi:cell division protein FtsB
MKLPRFRLTISSVINVVGGLVVVYLLVVLGQTIKRNYDLNNQITELKAQTELLDAQKDELRYNIEYYRTDSFRDREARSKLGLQKPGENVIIIPESSPSPLAQAIPAKTNQAPSTNFDQWMNFLFGRQ